MDGIAQNEQSILFSLCSLKLVNVMFINHCSLSSHPSAFFSIFIFLTFFLIMCFFTCLYHITMSQGLVMGIS